MCLAHGASKRLLDRLRGMRGKKGGKRVGGNGGNKDRGMGGTNDEEHEGHEKDVDAKDRRTEKGRRGKRENPPLSHTQCKGQSPCQKSHLFPAEGEWRAEEAAPPIFYSTLSSWKRSLSLMKGESRRERMEMCGDSEQRWHSRRQRDDW